MSAAASRMTNGDLMLALSGTKATIEPRKNGPQQVVVQYGNVAGIGGTPAVTLSAGTLGAVTMAGNVLTVNLSGVPDKTCLSITISGVEDAAGGCPTAAQTIKIGCLYGDVDGSGLVDGTDATKVKSKSGQAPTAATFLLDVDSSGLIDATDATIVKSKAGNTLSCAY